jgi:TDG/mug DNA glycosylase family protein
VKDITLAKKLQYMSMGNRIDGFPPTSASNAQVLILGTLPGKRSLKVGEYYADPNNGFWSIFGIQRKAPYSDRVTALSRLGVVIWDVLESGERTGSQDKEIRNPTPNDFTKFFKRNNTIELVCFNGQKAKELYEATVDVTLDREMQYETLPSTSGAYRTTTPKERLLYWRRVMGKRVPFAPIGQ